jgi:hypothetical protein
MVGRNYKHIHIFIHFHAFLNMEALQENDGTAFRADQVWVLQPNFLLHFDWK